MLKAIDQVWYLAESGMKRRFGRRSVMHGIWVHSGVLLTIGWVLSRDSGRDSFGRHLAAFNRHQSRASTGRGLCSSTGVSQTCQFKGADQMVEETQLC